MSSSTCRFSKIAPFAAKRRQFAVFAHEQALYSLMLVIQGGKDFRVPERQAMEAFGTAQLRGMPSRFLYLPNEWHWVLKLQNAVLWQRVFFEWLGRTLKPNGQAGNQPLQRAVRQPMRTAQTGGGPPVVPNRRAGATRRAVGRAELHRRQLYGAGAAVPTGIFTQNRVTLQSDYSLKSSCLGLIL